MSDDNEELQGSQEDLRDEIEEQLDEPTDEVESSVVDEEEVRARANGWDPTKGSKTAREFNLTGDLIELKKTIQKRDRDIEDMLKYQNNAIEAQKIRFKQELEYRLQHAKETGDLDAVESITKERADIEQRENLQRQQQVQADIKVAVENFAHRNSAWYNPNRQDLINEAVQLETEILQGTYAMKTGIPQPKDYSGVLAQIELAMKAKHPEIAGDGIKEASRPNLSGSRVNKSIEDAEPNEQAAFNRLSAEEKSMFNILKRTVAKSGAKYTVKEFLKKVKHDSGDYYE